MTPIINDLLADQVLTALITGLCILTAADFVVAVGAAFGRKDFDPTMVGDFILSHIVARVIPIAFCAILGHWYAPLGAVAALAGAAYLVETLASIRESWQLGVDGSAFNVPPPGSEY